MKKIIASLVLGLVASVSFAAGPAPHPHTPPVKHEVVKPVHKAHVKPVKHMKHKKVKHHRHHVKPVAPLHR